MSTLFMKMTTENDHCCQIHLPAELVLPETGAWSLKISLSIITTLSYRESVLVSRITYMKIFEGNCVSYLHNVYLIALYILNCKTCLPFKSVSISVFQIGGNGIGYVLGNKNWMNYFEWRVSNTWVYLYVIEVYKYRKTEVYIESPRHT
jgi:hypothetical protein